MVFKTRHFFMTAEAVLIAALLFLTSCAQMPDAPHLRPLSAKTYQELAAKGMKPEAPIFVRIFKEESEFELWKAKDDGRYYHFKTYPICKWSGELGPKQQEGDKQAPEGFYTIKQNQMKPDSQFHLAFNIGYPNAYDRAHGRTGQHLMVHGDCRSAGCYAMTDALAEEIYVLAREAFKGGQISFDVHAYPFRMTDEKMKQNKKHKWISFWKTMKEGYESFEMSRIPPKIDVCNKNYLINASFSDTSQKIEADLPCPAYTKIKPDLFAAGKGTAPIVPLEAKVTSAGKNGSDQNAVRSANGFVTTVEKTTEKESAKPLTGQNAVLKPEKVSATDLGQSKF